MLNVPEAVVLIRIQFSLVVRLQRPVGENRSSRTLSRTESSNRITCEMAILRQLRWILD